MTADIIIHSHMWTPEPIAVVVLAFLLGGIVKGFIGVGLPAVSLPILAIVLGLKEAIALIIVPAFATNVWQGLVGGRFWILIRRLWPLLLASLAGIWFGAGILAKSDADLLSGVLGVLLCVYVAYLVMAPRIPEPGRLEPALSPVVGALSGLMIGLTGSYVIPGVIYLQALNLGRGGLVQAMGVAFAVAAVGLAIAFQGHGQLTAGLALMSVIAVAPAFAGMFLGQRMRGRLDQEGFRKVFLVGLFLLGMHLAAKAFL